MLQQTQAARVAEKWKDFLKRFPTLGSLASAPFNEVITQWEGLGYNTRALRLHQCVQSVVLHNAGYFPDSLGRLTELPGVGRYTAHALLCFAFKKRVPVVDINVRRILTRVFGNRTDARALIPENRAWTIAEEILPLKKYYEWNQALMDLGAMICRARAPRCGACPLEHECRSAHAIRIRSKRPIPKKPEPMVGNVPRRLIRGKIIQHLRISGSSAGVSLERIVAHLRTIYPRTDRGSVRRIIEGLAGEGLIVLRRGKRLSIHVSFPP